MVAQRLARRRGRHLGSTQVISAVWFVSELGPTSGVGARKCKGSYYLVHKLLVDRSNIGTFIPSPKTSG